MAVTGVLKPEAEIVRRVREAVGHVPIVATFDLHANEDRELLDAADGAFIVKRYPHYDASLQGERALRYLLRVIRGTYKPAKATRKPGVITPSVVQGTGVSPALQIMERARIWEERTPDAFVSVAFGFAYADVPDVGATVMVMTNDDQALADRIAQDVSDYIWRQRETFAGRKLPKVEDGVAQALATQRAGRTPIVVADHSDRTGNSTWILEELIRQRGRNYTVATIADDKAIQQLRSKAKVGDPVSVMVGGYADQYAGRPVKIDGTLEYLDKYRSHATVAVVRFGDNNRVVLTPVLEQVTTPEIIDDLKIGWGAVRHHRDQVARALLARVRGGRPGQGGRGHRRARAGARRPEGRPVQERSRAGPVSPGAQGRDRQIAVVVARHLRCNPQGPGLTLNAHRPTSGGPARGGRETAHRRAPRTDTALPRPRRRASAPA